MAKVVIAIDTSYKGAGTDQARAALSGVGKEATKAEKSVLSYAQALAAQQRAAGNLAGAQQTLVAALRQVDQASRQAINTEKQLISVQNEIQGKASGVTGALNSIGGALSAIKAAGIVGVAIQIGQAGLELAQTGAKADLVRQRFDSLAVAANTTGDALLAALKKGSGGEISDLNLQLAANKAQLLGVADSAEEFGVLMSIARDRAQQMGISTTQAFDDLTTGLGRGSRLILDNLGIIVNADAANEKYAASIGKAASALSDEERKQALINQVIADGRATIEATGGAVESHAASLARAAAAWDNLRDRVGAAIAGQVAPAADAFADLVGGLDGTSEGIAGAVQGLGNLSGILSGVGAQTQATADINRDLGRSFLELIGVSSELEQQWTSGGGTTLQLAAATSQLSAEYNTLAPTIQLATANYQVQASTLVDQIAKTQQSVIEGRQLADIQSTLAQLGPAVHGGLMTAVQAAQVLAAQYNITAAEALRLVNAQAQIAGMAGQKGAALNLITGNRLGRGTAPVGGGAGGAVGGFGGGVGRAIRAAATAPRVRGGGGGGGGARVSEEQKTADKIADINERLADRLAEIDKRAGEERLAAQRSLADAIAQSSADLIASQEANDLELVGASEDRKAELIAREQAEAKARIANDQAVAEARQAIAEGDAATAEDVLKIKQDQIAKQQSLDEEYAKRQQELAGDDTSLALLQQQYDEATKATADAAAVDIEIAQAKAAQKAQAAQQERDGVIAAAEDEKAKVTSASATTRAAVVSDLATQSTAAHSWAASISSAASSVVSSAQKAASAIRSIPAMPSGGGGGNKGGEKVSAAGGAQFVTRGRTTLTVGDNPGGAEFVSVIPLSGRGHTRGLHLAGGGGVVALPAPEEVKSLVDSGILNATAAGGGKGGKGGGGGKDAVASLKDALSAAKDAADFLRAMADLRKELGQPQPPIDPAYVQALADDAKTVAAIVGQQIVTISKDAAENAGRYFDSASGAIGILNDISDLRANLGEPTPPIDPAYVQALADDIVIAGDIVGRQIVPLADSSVDNLKNYADSVSGAVSILGDMADLRESLGKPQPPLDMAYVKGLAGEILVAGGILAREIRPVADKDVDNLKNYASSVSDAVGILKDMDDLRESLGEPQPAISEADVRRLAADAAQVTTIFRAAIVPTSEDQADAVGRYADAVGSGVSALKDTLGLSAEMFIDYRSPSNAQIQVVAKDAKRVAVQILNAAKTWDTEGLEAGKAYAEGIGATFSAFKDGLLFFDALKSGDFTLDRKGLASFEQSTRETLGVARRLGAIAATIPPGDIAALQTAATALSGVAEAAIRMTAVPSGATPSLGGLFGRGGGGNITYNIVINNPPASMNVGAVASQVKAAIQQSVGARR